MTTSAMGRIEIVGDAIALCMYGITIMFLAREWVRNRRNVPMGGSSAGSENFTQELGRLVKQPPPPLRAISDAEKQKISILAQELKQAPDKMQAQNGIDALGGASVGDQHGEVKKLADMGLNKEEIFKKVGIPKGEIELILKLKGMKSGMDKKKG